MNALQRRLKALDAFQQRHRWLAFPYAVFKKYGNDEAAYQGALITYYGFLSLFPLIIVATSIVQLLSNNNAALKARVVKSIGQYLPIVGSQIESSVHSPHKTGLALLISILITLYGARGVADAFRHALDHIWQIPHPERTGFPKNALKSIGIIVFGGGGFLLASILSGAATSLGHMFVFRALAILISVLIIFGVFLFLFTAGVSTKEPKVRDILVGAAIAAVGLQILQTLGGYIVTHQLNSLNSLYGTFAIVLGLLFWIYLQVQIILYAVETDAVRKMKLWPRSFQEPLIPPDKKAYRKYAQKETYHPHEEVEVTFNEPRQDNP